MYLMITSRCNMRCKHCCGAYGPKGEDMSMETFKAAMAFAEQYGDDESLSFGGGEPTVHPQFWEMLGYAVVMGSSVWLATNGKRKKDALQLLKAAGKGVISVELSLDEWHEPIDPEVEKKYRAATRAGIREVVIPIRAGRAKRLPAGLTKDGCPCEGWVVRPNGAIYACGCSDAPCIGSVHGVDITDERAFQRDCWKNWEESA